MWKLEIQNETSVAAGNQKTQRRFKRYVLHDDVARVSYDQVIQLWQQNETFNEWFTAELTATSSKAIRWETPYLTSQNLDRDFEFVLVDSPGLDRQSDQTSFADKFRNSEPNSVIAFPNLGRNGIMVVPTPGSDCPDTSFYCHLLSFLRSASAAQCNLLWQTVGQQMRMRINEIPVWLSTAGGGVAWLHVRLDNRPKYYAYAPYRNSHEAT